MLNSIKQAKDRILLTTYILKTDKTGKAFIEALSEAVRHGVDVRVLVDGIGELYSCPKASTSLVKNNVIVATFMPPSLFPPNVYLNMQNHRKLLVIDNELAFAGGMKISGDNTR
jgi:cardiolipin synthase